MKTNKNNGMKITIKHNGFHGWTSHSLIVDGKPGDRVQLTESQVRRLSGKACGMVSCKCGESLLAACDIPEPWNAASPVFLTIPESGEICVNGNYPQR